MSSSPLENLDALLRSAEFLHLTIAEADTETPEYCLAFRRDNRTRYIVRSTLEGVLSTATGTERRKRCSRCGEVKMLNEFPKCTPRPDRPEGRHSHCKICDRARKRGKYLRSQRRVAAAASIPTPQDLAQPMGTDCA